jgi:hypothetical protein
MQGRSSDPAGLSAASPTATPSVFHWRGRRLSGVVPCDCAVTSGSVDPTAASHAAAEEHGSYHDYGHHDYHDRDDLEGPRPSSSAGNGHFHPPPSPERGPWCHGPAGFPAPPPPSDLRWRSGRTGDPLAKTRCRRGRGRLLGRRRRSPSGPSRTSDRSKRSPPSVLSHRQRWCRFSRQVSGLWMVVTGSACSASCAGRVGSAFAEAWVVPPAVGVDLQSPPADQALSGGEVVGPRGDRPGHGDARSRSAPVLSGIARTVARDWRRQARL